MLVTRWLAACVSFSLTIAAGLSSLAAADPVPGLVATEPTSGRFVKTDAGYMVPYTATIPGTEIKFEMQPIPGGKFKFGSPDSEAGRDASEGPVLEVEVAPFWMASREVSWAEYKHYMRMHDMFKKLVLNETFKITDDLKPNLVTAPSNLYDPTFTFKLGAEPDQPAVTMSQFAAKQYTRWLSELTGQFYRLPSEAEWEYAARDGKTTKYFFGDDESKLGDYAWYYENSSETFHKLGTKKPSEWGLYDIYGNVGEWTLDEFTETGREKLAGKVVASQDAIVWPTKLFPRVIKGGSWDEDAAQCRAAARRKSDDDSWRSTDPNFPQSPWWFTEAAALSVGMRLMRPLTVPAQAEQRKFWDADIKQLQEDVAYRIDEEGRGARGIVTPDLPEQIKKIGQ